MNTLTRALAGLATAAVVLALAACGPDPIPEPIPVSAPTPPAAVIDGAQLQEILAAVNETLAAADAASDAGQLAGRVTGPALAMRTAEYELARISGGGNPVTPLVTEAQVSVVGATAQWPRVVEVITTIPEGTNLPLLITLVQPDPRTNFQLWSWVRLLPGVEMPATVNPATGSPVVPADSAELVASPAQAIERYVDLLNNPESEFAGSFTEDGLRTLFRSDLKALSDGAAEAGKVEQSAALTENGTYSLGTNDGGAIVVGAISRTLVLTRTVAGATLQVGEGLAYGGSSEVAGSLTASYLITLAFHVPVAGSEEQIELVGVEQVITGVTRDDSVSPD